MDRAWLVMLCCIELTGCTALWSGTAQPEPTNCVSNPTACGTDQVCNTKTEVCEPLVPSDLGATDLTSLLLPPTSFIFPGGLSSSLDFPRSAQYSLEATQAPATIYYTLDGTTPVPGAAGTQSGPSPVNLGRIAAGTQIRWSADYGAAYSLEQSHLFTATTTNPSPIDFGAIPDPAVFDQSGSSVVTVTPGTPLTGQLRFQAWQSTATGYCPGCIIQFVVSAETVGAVGCLNTVSGYGAFPGQSATVNFAFNAPMVAGVYKLYTGLSLQFGCDGTSPGGPEVGAIIVK